MFSSFDKSVIKNMVIMNGRFSIQDEVESLTLLSHNLIALILKFKYYIEFDLCSQISMKSVNCVYKGKIRIEEFIKESIQIFKFSNFLFLFGTPNQDSLGDFYLKVYNISTLMEVYGRNIAVKGISKINAEIRVKHARFMYLAKNNNLQIVLASLTDDKKNPIKINILERNLQRKNSKEHGNFENIKTDEYFDGH